MWERLANVFKFARISINHNVEKIVVSDSKWDCSDICGTLAAAFFIDLMKLFNNTLNAFFCSIGCGHAFLALFDTGSVIKWLECSVAGRGCFL